MWEKKSTNKIGLFFYILMCIHIIHFIIGERAEREENRNFLIFIFMFFFARKKSMEKYVWIRVLFSLMLFFPSFAFPSIFIHSKKKEERKRIGFIDKKGNNLCIIHWLKRTLGNLKIHTLIGSIWKTFSRAFEWFFFRVSLIYDWSKYVIREKCMSKSDVLDSMK